MKKYELLVIIDCDADDAAREGAMKLISDTIAEGNGTVSNVDKWGMKKFAYPINYKNEGYYVLYAFETTPDQIAELERRMRISDSIVRFMTTNVIENKKTEAAKVAKANRAEREAKAENDENARRAQRAPRAEKPEEVKEVSEAEKAEFVAAVEEPAQEVVAEAEAAEKAE